MAFCTDKYEVMHMGTSPALPNRFMYEVRTATSLSLCGNEIWGL